MTSERFHKAAKENAVEILKEAAKKDCNTRDESGMTPTLWAAFEGHIEALRMLVAKGGDPDKTDYFGNTALHLSAARGHDLCVRFLVKFGCNIWSLDIDRHSARELAAINGRDRILQFLDLAQADQELNNRKKSKLMKEKAEKDAEKRLKEFVKRQKLAELRAEKEQKKLWKDRNRVELTSHTLDNHEQIQLVRPGATLASYKGRIKPSPTYSDIVGTATKRHGSAVGRRALAKRNDADDFKVVEIEVDGKKSVRSLTGLRRDSEILYVSTFDKKSVLTNGNCQNRQNQTKSKDQNQQQLVALKRGKISDVWGTLNKAKSTPDLLGERFESEDEENGPPGITDDTALLQEPASIFNRPGFGSVAFRRSIATTLDNLPVTQVEIHRQPNTDSYPNSTNCSSTNSSSNAPEHHRNNRNVLQQQYHNNAHTNEEISIGSAGSLARRQSMWDDDLISDEDCIEEEWSPLQRFLLTNNLSSIHSVLEAEQIDLEALMLLTESDMAALKLPLGPKRKLMHAIASRKKALETQETVIKDIKL